MLHLPISYIWQYPSIYTYELVDRARQMASVAKSTASESQACRFNSCQGRDLKLHFFLVTKVFRDKCTVYKFPLDNFHLQYPSNIIHYPHKSLYYKPPPISPGFIYFRKQFLMGLYKGRRGGGLYTREGGLYTRVGAYIQGGLIHGQSFVFINKSGINKSVVNSKITCIKQLKQRHWTYINLGDLYSVYINHYINHYAIIVF